MYKMFSVHFLEHNENFSQIGNDSLLAELSILIDSLFKVPSIWIFHENVKVMLTFEHIKKFQNFFSGQHFHDVNL